MTEIPIQCGCGAFRAALSNLTRARISRVICYCDDCQAFARFLGQEGLVLDDNGGTEILQTSPANLRLTQGRERLSCIRLTPKGLLRWYTACCKTPLGNTLPTRQIPFVGVIHACFGSLDHASLDGELGPVQIRVHERFASPALTAAKKNSVPVTYLLRSLTRMIGARFRGDHLNTPFFDSASGQPVAEPYILSPQELQSVKSGVA